ncbi:MAG: DUF4239 domain-containing protein [Eudoraea sp.]|uniref:bestrophin-like domain n=1 Tax=Eudoraea sp. TaxID=1979955 RepID=UPI003C75E043
MTTSIFDSLPISIIFIGLCLLMLITFEIGYQISRRSKGIKEKVEPATLTPMIGGLIGLLGFLLAFTFSIATEQFSQRKQYVLEEANEIGTSYLRADLIDSKYKTEVKQLLRQYVDTRLRAVNSTNINNELLKSVELHNLLWSEVSAAALAKPNTNTSMMIQSINKIIDLHEKRVTAGLRNRIPLSIWITLLAISFMTMTTIGIKAGFTKPRGLIAVIPMILAFAALTTLIADLNRPQKGLFKVGQQSMISVQKNMQKDVK